MINLTLYCLLFLGVVMDKVLLQETALLSCYTSAVFCHFSASQSALCLLSVLYVLTEKLSIVIPLASWKIAHVLLIPINILAWKDVSDFSSSSTCKTTSSFRSWSSTINKSSVFVFFSCKKNSHSKQEHCRQRLHLCHHTLHAFSVSVFVFSLSRSDSFCHTSCTFLSIGWTGFSPFLMASPTNSALVTRQSSQSYSYRKLTLLLSPYCWPSRDEFPLSPWFSPVAQILRVPGTSQCMFSTLTPSPFPDEVPGEHCRRQFPRRLDHTILKIPEVARTRQLS